MNSPHACPKCGALLPADAPEGLCPACLMSGALPSEAGTVKLTPSQKPSAHEPSPTPTPADLAPLLPQLEILGLLGRGGMGAVYKARQTKLNRLVALKILPVDSSGDPHFAERFQREAQALAKLNHPNIVSVFDFGEADGLFFFLMEYVDGANLRTLIRSGEVKPEAALALIPAFCDALQYAHDEGVVHRDIKPENVLVDKKGRVKIADFGLAKLLGHDTPGDTLTRTGMHLGTPRYMAPEQFDKPETVDHRADIYSLGVVFYEMLTGELPMGRFDPPSKKVQVDVKLDDIVLRSLERDVDRRYQHASEIKTDVQGLGSASPSSDLKLREAVPNQTAAIRPRHPGALPSLICTGLGLLAAAVVFVLVSNVAWFWGLRAEGEPDFPPRFRPFIFTCLPLSILLSLAGTVWGWGVVRTIAASPSQWKGRGMAFAAAITVPVLFVDVLVATTIDGGATFIGRLAQWDYTTIASVWSALSIPACVLVTGWLVARAWKHLFVADSETARRPQENRGPRLSRMALIGAIWAFFALFVAIPMLIHTTTVRSMPAVSSGLVDARPDVLIIILMVVLLVIGAGAPIGTTILGAISMSKIKKSGGKLYGLPLAFADTIFFPMLLLHGAMAVILGLLIVTILKLAGVNAGLGVAEMGLLAMLPLVADFFIARSLWRKVAVGQPHPGGDIASRLNVAAIGLLLAGIADALAGLIWAGQNVHQVVEAIQHDWPVGWLVAETLLSVCMLSVVYYVIGAALFLLRREDEGDISFPLLIAAIVPPGCFVGLPAAVYAFVLLSRPEAKALFPQAKQEPEAGGTSAGAPRGKRLALAAIGIVAVLLGLFVMFSKREAMPGGLGLFASSTPLIIAEGPGMEEPNHYLCRYKISAPPDHRVAVWMEVTREGKPVVLPGLANQIEIAELLHIGESFEGSAEFSLMDGSRISPDSKGKWRWDFKYSSRSMRTAPGGWIDNPFEGKGMTNTDLGPKRWQPKPGETVSIMVIRAGREFSGSDFTQQPPAGEIELRLKARIDLVPLFHRRVSHMFSTSSSPFPAPEKPLNRIAAGFGIDTKLSDEEIRRALVEKLKTNPDKRADAGAILKSMNAAPAETASPEELAKALEKLSETMK